MDENRTHKKYLLVRNEGNRSVKRSISHYNLDMIQYESDFDRAVRELTEQQGELPLGGN